jgi:Ca2+/Na+ antiporter
MCAEKGVACALYDGFSQPWLAAGQAESFNNFWGVCSGTPPYSCSNAPGAAGAPLPTAGATTSTTVAVTALPTTTSAGDTVVAAVFPTGAVVGGIVGGVAAILLIAILVVILIICIRVKRKKDTEDASEQKRRLIMLELENQQPNYTKVVMLVRECGMQLKNPTGVFIAATNRDSIDPMAAGGFMCLLDLLTMYMLLDKVNTKLDARTRDRILKAIDMVNKLESPGSTKPDTKFHSDCALGFMNLLLALDQNRVALQHVIETSKSNVIIPQTMKSIEQGWIFKLLLVRLISQEAKRSLEQLQRLIHGNVMSTREWHIIYDHVLVLCDVSMNMPKIAIMAMTDMKIIGDITNVEDTQAIGKIFNALASCNCLTPEQNKSVRLLALQGMQDIIQSPRCHLLVKKEAVMTLVLRRLLENEDEIIPVVASVSENSDLDSWKSQIEDNWNVVISLVDDKFEEQLIAKQKVNEMKQELDAWEFDIQQGNAMLTTLQNVGEEDVKTKRQKVAIEDKVIRSQSEKERLQIELVNAEARYDELTSEFKALKRNFETIQQNYKVPQLQVHKLTGRTNTDSNLRSLNERRNSLDAMSSERLWTAVEETYYDDVPMSLKCPLTKATFIDPVIVVSNGTTYERSAIEAWFASHDDDPLTHEPVSNKTLVTNNAMKKMVNEFNLAHYEQVNIV